MRNDFKLTPSKIPCEEVPPGESPSARTDPSVGPRQKALVLGLELSKRAVSVRTLDELYFLIVNDLRSLIEFDRCFLITHRGGESSFTAANNQPTLENRSKLYAEVSALAPVVTNLRKALVIPNDPEGIEFPEADVSERVRNALRAYLFSSSCSYFACVPLIRGDLPIAHLILEFYGDRQPQQFEVLGLINIAPLLAAALAEKWMLELHPELDSMAEGRGSFYRRASEFIILHWQIGSIVAMLIILGLFLFPVYFKVGGEAEIAPLDRRTAFCKIEGLIDKVSTSEGAEVTQHQVLAVLDPRDQNYAIETLQREAEILNRQAKHLALESDETPAKLAERQILELERRKRLAELDYKKWQAQFLEIRAPVPGIIMTRDVESLAGKRMKAGEPFCDIAVPGELVADIYVPEDKGTIVKPGQPAYLYLNNNPGKAYDLIVQEVAPCTEVIPRLGNVLRVRAGFQSLPAGIRVGMKGIGKILTEKTNLWSALSHGVLVRWNYLSLYF